jgi:hypothetical protein
LYKAVWCRRAEANYAAKAVGPPRSTDDHAHQFGRIELIVVDGDTTKRLDLADEQVRAQVKMVTTTEQLRRPFDSA